MTITVVTSVSKIVFPSTDAVADPIAREAFDVLRRVIRTLTNSVTVTGTLTPDSGGTGITSYTIGDLIYASAPTTLSKLADVASGKPLLSGGIGAAPAWGSTALGTAAYSATTDFDASGAAATVQGNLTTHIGQTGTAVHGLGTISTQNANNVAITGGSIGSTTLNADSVSTYLDFVAQGSNPPAPAAGTVRFHSATTQGFTRFEQDNEAATNLVLGRDNVFIAKNTSGSPIAVGQPVYVTGSTGNVPNVGLAKADSSTTLPAVGLALDAIGNNNFGQVMKLGIIASINTSAYSVGDSLWVSTTTAGAFQNTRPTPPNLVQRMATVLVSGVGNGSILVVTAPFVGGMETGTTSTTWQFNGHTLSMPADASVSGTNTGDVAFGGMPDIMAFAAAMG